MKPTVKQKLRTTTFWTGLVSAVILFGQALAKLFGYEVPEDMMGQVVIVVNSFLSVLTISGVLIGSQTVESFQTLSAKVKGSTAVQMFAKK